MDDLECPSGLWDGYPGPPVDLSDYRDCSQRQDCAYCGVLLAILAQTRPSWLSGSGRELAVALKPQERWVFNTNLALPNAKGSGSIRLFEDGKQVDSLQLYRPITDVQKLSLISWDRYEKLFFGECLDIAPSSDSPAAFKRAAQWLSDCTEHHGCYTASTFLPSRVLRIDPSASSATVQLVEGSTLQASPYAALSYCWGRDTTGVLTTTRANYDAHLAGIPVASLPRTVQDAVTVCRRLGLLLLWVDALCIVQDDVDDWRREAGRMIDIYSHSFLTVSASEPDSCKTGFLGRQAFGAEDWQRAIPVRLPPSLSQGGPDDHLLLRDSRVRRPRLFSLDSRGWCLQESVMPRRRLVFDGCEMSWNCLDKMLCECGHLDEQACGVYPHLRTGRGSGGEEKEEEEEELSSYAKLHMEWMDFAEEYSQRALTKATDKLVAISGVVRQFQARFEAARVSEAVKDAPIAGLFRNRAVRTPSPGLSLGNGYFGGLWGDCFLPNLAWTVDHTQLEKSGRTEHRRIQGGVAPSWSWASIDGPVTFRHLEISVGVWDDKAGPQLVCDAIVRGVTCEPVSQNNPHGALASSRLVIAGPLVPVELAVLHPGDARGGTQYFWYRRVAGQSDGAVPCRRQCFVRTPRLQCWRVFTDEERQPTIPKASPLVDCWSQPRHMDGEGCGCVFDASTEYACLRLMTYRARDVYGRDGVPAIVLFLLLRRVDGEGTYTRVGLGLWNKDEGMQEVPMNGGDYPMFADASWEELVIV